MERALGEIYLGVGMDTGWLFGDSVSLRHRPRLAAEGERVSQRHHMHLFLFIVLSRILVLPASHATAALMPPTTTTAVVVWTRSRGRSPTG